MAVLLQWLDGRGVARPLGLADTGETYGGRKGVRARVDAE
jgi:hypothetical protein